MQVANFSKLSDHQKQQVRLLHNKPYVYIGRNYAGLKDRGLGNPFSIREDSLSERNRVVKTYREWLWDQLKKGTEKGIMIQCEFSEWTDETILVCWCSPKLCHGEVLIKAWQWWNNK